MPSRRAALGISGMGRARRMGALFRDFHLLRRSRFCMSYLPASADNAFLLSMYSRPMSSCSVYRRMQLPTKP